MLRDRESACASSLDTGEIFRSGECGLLTAAVCVSTKYTTRMRIGQTISSSQVAFQFHKKNVDLQPAA